MFFLKDKNFKILIIIKLQGKDLINIIIMCKNREYIIIFFEFKYKYILR